MQGTWEIRFAKVLDLIDPNWVRPTSGMDSHTFEWVDDENVKHNYTPDFYSPLLNKYFEIKGYWWGNDKRKMELVMEIYSDTNIEIVRKKELIQYEKLIN